MLSYGCLPSKLSGNADELRGRDTRGIVLVCSFWMNNLEEIEQASFLSCNDGDAL